MPGLNLKELIEKAPRKLTRVRSGEFHRVSCPYCIIGSAQVMVVRSGAQIRIEDAQSPRRCLSCGKEFKLKTQFRIAGERINKE